MTEPLINRVNEDLAKIMSNNTIVRFTDMTNNNYIDINGIVVKKDLTYSPLENTSIVAPEHRITVRKADFTLEPNDILRVKVSWTTANNDVMEGVIMEVYKSETMSLMTFLIKIGIRG